MGFGHFPFVPSALFSTFSSTPNMGKPHVTGPGTRHITLCVWMALGEAVCPAFWTKMIYNVKRIQQTKMKKGTAQCCLRSRGKKKMGISISGGVEETEGDKSMDIKSVKSEGGGGEYKLIICIVLVTA